MLTCCYHSSVSHLGLYLHTVAFSANPNIAENMHQVRQSEFQLQNCSAAGRLGRKQDVSPLVVLHAAGSHERLIVIPLHLRNEVIDSVLCTRHLALSSGAKVMGDWHPRTIFSANTSQQAASTHHRPETT